jgi:hypothetical protein
VRPPRPGIPQKKMKPEKITNQRGFLCRSMDGKTFFRTYNADGSFRDFDIAHHDLEIEIVDSDAYIYRTGETLVIDHGPDTLGIVDDAAAADSAPEKEG